MKKIFVFAGAVLLFILLLTTWLFIVDFSDFAKVLGDKTKDAGTDEKTKFIGTWETTYIEGDKRFFGYNGIYKFSSDGTGTVGGLICSWEIKNSQLIIDLYEYSSKIIYKYFFSEDFESLTLYDSKGSIEFSKSLI